MRVVMACFLIFSVFSLSYAQTTPGVMGQVVNSADKKPVAYATVALLLKDSIVATGFTDEDGRFALTAAAGQFVIEVSFVGFKTASQQVHIGAGLQQLPAINLETGSDTMEEIRITARKKLIEQKPGMLLYNADNDLGNKGGTAADVLRKAPILNVDAQGNVTMRGNGNIKILVNGKYSGQMARSPADALNMMPSDMIKSVEIITTPSAKYDAEGAAGVINIITKKNNQQFSGALELGLSNLEQFFNPRIAFSKNKWSVNVHGHLHRLRMKSASELERTAIQDDKPGNSLLQQVEKDNIAPHGSADINIGYALDSLSEISLAINAWFGDFPDNMNLRSTVFNNNGVMTDEYLQRAKAKSSYLGSDISVGYSKKFSRAGQELTVLGMFTPARDNTDYDTRQLNMQNDLLYRELNDNHTFNREYTLQIDYQHPLTKKGNIILETGVKGISRNVRSNYLVKGTVTGTEELEKINSRSDLFRYQQHVGAVYGMLKMSLADNWYAEAGTRVEHTSLEGVFRDNPAAFNNRFTNIVPTAVISKKMKDGHSIAISYTKRLTRPYIWDLNPNVDASDPKNLQAGNPALQPEIAHQGELSYSISAGTGYFINLSAYVRQTDGAIVQFTSVDAAGISTTRKENLAGNRQAGLNLSSSFTIYCPHW